MVLPLSADFWLARGIDDVTVQKSADSVALNPHTVNYLLSYKRVDESPQKLLQRNAPYVTEHALKVSTRSVYPYARESLREKLQQDRQTDNQAINQSINLLYQSPHTSYDQVTKLC